MAFSKKGGAEDKPLTIMIPLILGLAFLVMIVLFFNTSEIFTVEYWEEVGCWATNNVACGGGFTKYLPSSCVLTMVDEPVDEAKFAEMLTDTWWMYGKNECDYTDYEAYTFLVYNFEVEKEIQVNDFFEYLTTHKDGEEAKSIVYSDLNELEENSPSYTLCFDIKFSDTIKSGKFIPNEEYFIMYYDAISSNEFGDKIIITQRSDLDKDTLLSALGDTFNNLRNFMSSRFIAVYDYIGDEERSQFVGSANAISNFMISSYTRTLEDPDSMCIPYTLETLHQLESMQNVQNE